MNSQDLDYDFLKKKSQEIRIEILKAIHKSGKGHIGGSYSIVEILVTLFYGGVIKFDSKNPNWGERDRFILSKGHAGIALYAVLADLGFFPKEELNFFNRGRMLGEHPYPGIPGIEIISGSLGHGLPIGSGMALADKIDKKVDRKTIVLMGDGECYEGSVWEAAIFAAHHKLSKLIAIVDRNNLITHGTTESINKLEPFREKWESFGWDVYEVNAHDISELLKIWEQFQSTATEKPFLVIAHSTKGKGISFMENQANWHHGGIDDEKFRIALEELKAANIK